MRDFTRPSGRLRALPFLARGVYTVFIMFTLVALGLTGWLASEMVGADLAQLGPYYSGEPEQSTSALEPGGGGPALELPDDLPAPIAEAMPRRKLLEVTHFHLFSMPVYLLILSHLFMLCALRDLHKLGWIALASLATGAHVAAPWIAMTGWWGSPAIYAGSGALLAISFLVMAIVPLWEMWARPRVTCGPLPVPKTRQ